MSFEIKRFSTFPERPVVSLFRPAAHYGSITTKASPGGTCTPSWSTASDEVVGGPWDKPYIHDRQGSG
jgi:hypothetical protein